MSKKDEDAELKRQDSGYESDQERMSDKAEGVVKDIQDTVSRFKKQQEFNTSQTPAIFAENFNSSIHSTLELTFEVIGFNLPEEKRAELILALHENTEQCKILQPDNEKLNINTAKVEAALQGYSLPLDPALGGSVGALTGFGLDHKNEQYEVCKTAIEEAITKLHEEAITKIQNEISIEELSDPNKLFNELAKVIKENPALNEIQQSIILDTTSKVFGKLKNSQIENEGFKKKLLGEISQTLIQDERASDYAIAMNATKKALLELQGQNIPKAEYADRVLGRAGMLLASDPRGFSIDKLEQFKNFIRQGDQSLKVTDKGKFVSRANKFSNYERSKIAEAAVEATDFFIAELHKETAYAKEPSTRAVAGQSKDDQDSTKKAGLTIGEQKKADLMVVEDRVQKLLEDSLVPLGKNIAVPKETQTKLNTRLKPVLAKLDGEYLEQNRDNIKSDITRSIREERTLASSLRLSTNPSSMFKDEIRVPEEKVKGIATALKAKYEKANQDFVEKKVTEAFETTGLGKNKAELASRLSIFIRENSIHPNIVNPLLQLQDTEALTGLAESVKLTANQVKNVGVNELIALRRNNPVGFDRIVLTDKLRQKSRSTVDQALQNITSAVAGEKVGPEEQSVKSLEQSEKTVQQDHVLQPVKVAAVDEGKSLTEEKELSIAEEVQQNVNTPTTAIERANSQKTFVEKFGLVRLRLQSRLRDGESINIEQESSHVSTKASPPPIKTSEEVASAILVKAINNMQEEIEKKGLKIKEDHFKEIFNTIKPKLEKLDVGYLESNREKIIEGIKGAFMQVGGKEGWFFSSKFAIAPEMQQLIADEWVGEVLKKESETFVAKEEEKIKKGLFYNKLSDSELASKLSQFLTCNNVTDINKRLGRSDVEVSDGNIKVEKKHLKIPGGITDKQLAEIRRINPKDFDSMMFPKKGHEVHPDETPDVIIKSNVEKLKSGKFAIKRSDTGRS